MADIKPKVLVGYPVYGYITSEALAAFVTFMVRNTVKGLIAGFFQIQNYILGKSRSLIAGHAIQGGFSHVLFVDADMLVPVEALEKLLARKVPIVSALYFRKSPPYFPVVQKLDGAFDYAFPKEGGLYKTEVVGMGCCLIEVPTLTQIVMECPPNGECFQFDKNEGEDVFFCRKAKELGIPVYVDLDVKCGHVTEKVVEFEDFIQPEHAKARDLITGKVIA